MAVNIKPLADRVLVEPQKPKQLLELLFLKPQKKNHNAEQSLPLVMAKKTMT